MTHPTRLHSHDMRFRIKSADAIRGAVDGAWWPESRDLPTELLSILPDIHSRVSSLERVCYRYSEWNPAPRKVALGDRPVKLDGYAMQELDTVRFVGSGASLVIAVIPPDTEPDAAAMAMTLAMTGARSQHAHTLNIQAVGAASTVRQNRAAETAWESEGGHPPSVGAPPALTGAFAAPAGMPYVIRFNR
jgi:hypothetical protein